MKALVFLFWVVFGGFAPARYHVRLAEIIEWCTSSGEAAAI